MKIEHSEVSGQLKNGIKRCGGTLAEGPQCGCCPWSQLCVLECLTTCRQLHKLQCLGHLIRLNSLVSLVGVVVLTTSQPPRNTSHLPPRDLATALLQICRIFQYHHHRWQNSNSSTSCAGATLNTRTATSGPGWRSTFDGATTVVS